jgi:hypothetical protein
MGSTTAATGEGEFTEAVRAFATVGCPQLRLARGGTGCFTRLKTFAAEYRSSLGGTERNGGFASTLGTDRGCFHTAGRTCPFGRAVLPFCFARLAALRFVPEFLLVVELLFAGGEEEVGAAVHAFQNPILKVRHGTILGSKHPEKDQRSACQCAPPAKKPVYPLC